MGPTAGVAHSERRTPLSTLDSPPSGFTLIEIITVIVIIGIISSLIVVVWSKVRLNAKIKATRAALEVLSSAVALYEEDWRTYPPEVGATTKDRNKNLVQTLLSHQKNGPYLDADCPFLADLDGTNEKEYFVDAFPTTVPSVRPGNPFDYRNPGTKNVGGVDIFSAGPDGDYSTEDDNITNWQRAY